MKEVKRMDEVSQDCNFCGAAASHRVAVEEVEVNLCEECFKSTLDFFFDGMVSMFAKKIAEGVKRKGMKYILNSAVLTAPGVYAYRRITAEHARKWYGDGEGVVSAIGYAETAEALGQLLGKPVSVNRISVTMEPGDEALVFRLLTRVAPEDKGRIAELVSAGDWELGLLKRLD